MSLLLSPLADCNLNVHHQCQEKVPPMCGADISEVRGKLLLYVELKGNNLKVESEYGLGQPKGTLLYLLLSSQGGR